MNRFECCLHVLGRTYAVQTLAARLQDYDDPSHTYAYVRFHMYFVWILSDSVLWIFVYARSMCANVYASVCQPYSLPEMCRKYGHPII